MFINITSDETVGIYKWITDIVFNTKLCSEHVNVLFVNDVTFNSGSTHFNTIFCNISLYRSYLPISSMCYNQIVSIHLIVTSRCTNMNWPGIILQNVITTNLPQFPSNNTRGSFPINLIFCLRKVIYFR